ncbi:LmeA family phospholipid-binding protein [Mycobacterium branderi]|uniref:DUF2993 domain-containing protein n=1 Tax=Mycobacterium branderi TaxID=43348 RepID=A0A7I7W196_9MYCO|nr:DUF2993 domain-containing protein [Mycobacterium branderi]MCV7233608.1 DUF2993 domain-containing protein [Mycobacterium branderi]ORA41636.1 hypothetical protein BST20_06045 [Mycobacterium branderi]BBZ10727.1 hypothetical protein MBRA_09220 [Mycobacterium branderi]
MTNPQGPPPDDPSIWARPGSEGAAQPHPPSEPPPGVQEYPAEDAATVKMPGKTKRRLFRDPLSMVLVAVIVLLLCAAGVVGGELYARHRADSVVAAATECVVQDKASVSFGPYPFLLQHLAGDYRDISIKTAGNQIRSAKGMRADIEISEVNLHGDANSKGTIRALDAAITWSSEGIKETVADAVPFVGGLVNSVTTNPSAGTIELKGALGLGSVTVKPAVANNGLSLKVVTVTAMGAPVPAETAQDALDVFTSRLINDYPLGIHADAVQVTDDGVKAHFSTRNASIPPGQSDPCFAKL